MKKLFLTLTLSASMLLTTPFSTIAQNNRPGKAPSTSVTRPGTSNVRPGTTTNRPGNNLKPGDNTKPAAPPANRPGNNIKPGNNTNRPGSTAATRPGTPSRPATVNPPVRPNRLPATMRPIPARPSNWRPGNVAFRNTILGISFGTSLMNSLNYLYGANYTIDGYGTNEVYLRNVTEMNYNWTDATLFYNNGFLTQSMFYESTIADNTSLYHGVFNQIRSLYGQPASRSVNGRNLNSAWWGPNGEYITLEYSLQKAINGYRYFTILTIGR